MPNARATAAQTPMADFSRELLLRNGAMLRVRAPHAGDRERLREMLARCSPASIRYRYLHPIKTLPDDLLDRLVQFDGARYVALVVTQGEAVCERIVAVGQYFALDDRPEVAEVSFLVEDALQRRGIGTLLLDMLADNYLMLSVFRKAGYALSSATSYGVTHLEFPIAPNEVAQARAEAQEAEAECASLRYVLAQQSIALMGASRN